MKQEDKELLLKDISARLPYGVKLYANYVDGINTKEGKGRLSMIDNDMVVAFIDETENTCSFTYVALHEVKPYLFPMSSMTKDIEDEIYKETGLYDIMENDMVHIEVGVNFLDVCKVFSILNKHHLDYNDLIPMGLAKDATGLNIY